jgi:hypothetical protein
VLTDYHKGNWSLKTARSMKRFLMAQPYIAGLDICPYDVRGKIDYDLQNAEDDYNPEAFGMSREEQWPGRAPIIQRYAHHFDLTYDGTPWLVAPAVPCDVAFHCPMRRSLRSFEDWLGIVTSLAWYGATVAVLGDEPPLNNRQQDDNWDLLDSAQYIAGAKVFLGTVSCCNAIAEGLGVPRLVEQAEDCFNVNPTLSLNGLSNADVVATVRRYL